MAQFSRFIRPGCQIVESSDGDSLAAYDPAKKQLTIVSVNDGSESRSARFKLAGVGTASADALPYRSSLRESVAQLPPVILEGGFFEADLPARSVTTFIISGVELTPKSPSKNDIERAGSEPAALHRIGQLTPVDCLAGKYRARPIRRLLPSFGNC